MRRTLLLVTLLGGCASARPPSAPLALGPTHLWVAPMRVYSGGGVWFPAELEVVEDAVAAFLEAHEGFEVVSLPALRRLRKNVRAGFLPGRRDVCPRPPPPAELTRVMYGGARSASVVLDCDGPVCKLVVGVHTADLEPRGHTNDLMRFEAPVPPGTGPKTWAQIVEAGLLAQVPLPEPAGGLGIGGIAGSRRPGVHAWFQSVEQSGPWTSKLTSAPIQPVKEALHACAGNHSAWNDFWAVDHLVELDEVGFVSRCEDNLPDHLPPPAFSCRCEILRRVAFGAGAPGRRARLNLITTVVKPGPAKEDPHFRSIYFAEPRAEDPSATLGSNGFSRADLRACIANAKPFGHAKAPTALSVDADGQVTAAHIEWPQMVPEDVRACVQASVLRGQLSCPLRGPAKVTGVLDVEVVTLETLRRSRGW